MLFLFALFLVSVQCAPQFVDSENPTSLFQEFINLDGGGNSAFQVDEYRSRLRRCADHHTELPFVIAENFSKESRETILQSLAHFSDQTCLKFRELNENETEVTYAIVFSPLTTTTCGFSTYVNETTDRAINFILLNEPFCFNGTGRINRALYLSLGFTSEVVRQDRDNYVTVLWENIKPDWEFKFEINEEITPDSPYDYSSISHYYPNDYAKDGKLTLVSKIENQPLQWNTELSTVDKYKINAVYCNLQDETTTSSSTTTKIAENQ